MGNGSTWDNPMDNPNSPENSSSKEVETCEICIEPIMTQEMKFANNKRQCVHSFCTDCIAKCGVLFCYDCGKVKVNCECTSDGDGAVRRFDARVWTITLILYLISNAFFIGSVVGLHKVKGNTAVATMLAISVVLDCALVPIPCVKELSEKPEGDGDEGRLED
ncbi:hypothetical protein NE237_026782 [Protea cynaroides]|uniref:RING-type domain-containing protein n=1 Tax=Protea cynaroides TaxID=273540 RepID=A0A9Q0GM58_9MAGN|nr:hypothetical protein NE237_026782 [Protea cynaroides]